MPLPDYYCKCYGCYWVGGQIVFESWKVPDDKHLFAKEWKRDFYQKNLDKLKEDKQTMTREEALNIAKEKYIHSYAEKFISVLEALGVLKFEVEERTIENILYEARDKNWAPQYVRAELEKHGYLIVRKGNKIDEREGK